MTDETEYPDNSVNVLVFTKRFDAHSDIKEMRNITEARPPEDARYCRHERTEVDEHGRILKCRRCGAALDPFDWILKIAKKETVLDWELKSLRGEISDHRKGLENLKREENNTRARLKTDRMKLADVEGEVWTKNRELKALNDRIETQMAGGKK